MNVVNCPECGEDFDLADAHWVTNAEGGVMYRLPCEHMVVGTWRKVDGDGRVGPVAYGPEHIWARPLDTEHHHRFFHDTHHGFIDELDKILEEKVHEQ